MQLLAVPELGVAENVTLFGPTVIDDRIVVNRLESWDALAATAFAMDECGKDHVELASMGGLVGGAGDWAFAARDDEDGLRSVALDGRGPSDLVFDRPIACVIVMDEELVAADTDGTLWYLADPDDPRSEPVELVRGAVVPSYAATPTELTECWAAYGDLPVRDGDGLLVAFRDGPLARVSVPSGEREVLVDGPVGEFVVLEDARYILWRGGSGPDQEGLDCCDLHVLDRKTGGDLDVPGSTIPEDVAWAGEWLSTCLWADNSGDDWKDVFTNVVTGESFSLDGCWGLDARLDETHLLLSPLGDEGSTSVVDTRTQKLQPLDFPAPPWDSPTYPDGVIALDRAEGADVGALVRLPFDRGPIEVLARDVHQYFARTQSGDIVYVQPRSEDEVVGTLVHVTRDGTKHEVAADVSDFVIPFHGTEREREEVLFVVAGPERGGLWRYVLP